MSALQTPLLKISCLNALSRFGNTRQSYRPSEIGCYHFKSCRCECQIEELFALPAPLLVISTGAPTGWHICSGS